MDIQYVKYAVLRASVKEAWKMHADPAARRKYVQQMVGNMESGFKHAHNFTCAWAMRDLAMAVRSSSSLLETLRRLEEDVYGGVGDDDVPHSNTGHTALSEPLSVETSRMRREVNR